MSLLIFIKINLLFSVGNTMLFPVTKIDMITFETEMNKRQKILN